jgi:hypothetical protein
MIYVRSPYKHHVHKGKYLASGHGTANTTWQQRVAVDKGFEAEILYKCKVE